MSQETQSVKRPNNLIVESRKKMSVSGVKDVASFDDNTVIALTDLGALTVRGENLRVDCLSVETGELEISGTINGVMYTDDKKVQSGFFARFLK